MIVTCAKARAERAAMRIRPSVIRLANLGTDRLFLIAVLYHELRRRALDRVLEREYKRSRVAGQDIFIERPRIRNVLAAANGDASQVRVDVGIVLNPQTGLLRSRTCQRVADVTRALRRYNEDGRRERARFGGGSGRSHFPKSNLKRALRLAVTQISLQANSDQHRAKRRNLIHRRDNRERIRRREFVLVTILTPRNGFQIEDDVLRAQAVHRDLTYRVRSVQRQTRGTNLERRMRCRRGPRRNGQDKKAQPQTSKQSPRKRPCPSFACRRSGTRAPHHPASNDR